MNKRVSDWAGCLLVRWSTVNYHFLHAFVERDGSLLVMSAPQRDVALTMPAMDVYMHRKTVYQCVSGQPVKTLGLLWL